MKKTKSEMHGDELQEIAQKQSKGAIFKQYFTARRIAYIATFTAISFALRFLQFPILPAVPFLKWLKVKYWGEGKERKKSVIK